MRFVAWTAALMLVGCAGKPAAVPDASPPKELAAKFSEVIADSPDKIARALVEDWDCKRIEIVSASHLKLHHVGSWAEGGRSERPVEVKLLTDLTLETAPEGTKVSFQVLPEFSPDFEANGPPVRTDW